MKNTQAKNQHVIDMFSGVSNTASLLGKNAFKGVIEIINYGVSDLLKYFSLKNYFFNKGIESGILHFVKNASKIEKSETDIIFKIFTTDYLNGNLKSLSEYSKGQINKLISGMRYSYLINSLGRELFGSAKFKNEKILYENDFYTLTYIPPFIKGGKKAAVFHVGGMLPYSDKIFRLLPETNFYKPFLEQGFAVYAMEIKGDIQTNSNLKNLTVEKMVESVHSFSDIAFKHNGNNKMILEGYCGLAMPAIVSFLSDLKNMNKKFSVISLFVAPVDGTKCKKLNEMISTLPETLAYFFFLYNSLTGKVINGKNIGRSIDVVTGSLFDKTLLGRFLTGWQSGKYHNINSIDELDEKMRLELAGAYWISPQCSKRFPVPVEITRFSSALFKKGIDKKGIIPYKVNGKYLNINDFKKTNVSIIGFYGENDPMINHETGEVLKHILRKQYTHIIHEKTGHISYVFSNNRWYENNQKSFRPGIIPVLLEKLNNQ